ncbi:hypothetical protein N5D45_06705 [Stenotrophomonas sp. GD03819]|uniref:hypothetical protein n=1 Tax=Stenotrophomonas sp. GD03819 TaxID=2975384 RepID=UPI002448D4F8|nr:hypothetical protein [Stenotrophomonas sp. GD03819]MDH1791509.1 hypothetical protein [Stenotrophomonas sp. GD03819]
MRHINQKNVLDTDEWIGVDLELEFHEDGFEVPTNAGDEAEMYRFDNLEDFIATRAAMALGYQSACLLDVQ